MIARGMMTLLVVVLVGCGTPARTVRLKTGQGEPLVFTPDSSSESVELDEEDFEEALERMGRDVSVSANPRAAALTKALKRLAKEITTPDTRLNKWVTRTD